MKPKRTEVRDGKQVETEIEEIFGSELDERERERSCRMQKTRQRKGMLVGKWQKKMGKSTKI